MLRIGTKNKKALREAPFYGEIFRLFGPQIRIGMMT
jgi:hypothetical protein